MKILLLLFVVFAGCGTKSNDQVARDLITEKLKASQPDYESINFGTLGTAFLTYEETSQYSINSKALNDCKDSIATLEKIIEENNSAPTAAAKYKERIRQLLDSANAINERNNTAKQDYTPEKIFKISHSYKLKDKSGLDKKTEDEFYIDKDLKKILKVHKVY